MQGLVHVDIRRCALQKPQLQHDGASSPTRSSQKGRCDQPARAHEQILSITLLRRGLAMAVLWCMLAQRNRLHCKLPRSHCPGQCPLSQRKGTRIHIMPRVGWHWTSSASSSPRKGWQTRQRNTWTDNTNSSKASWRNDLLIFFSRATPRSRSMLAHAPPSASSPLRLALLPEQATGGNVFGGLPIRNRHNLRPRACVLPPRCRAQEPPRQRPLPRPLRLCAPSPPRPAAVAVALPLRKHFLVVGLRLGRFLLQSRP